LSATAEFLVRKDDAGEILIFLLTKKKRCRNRTDSHLFYSTTYLYPVLLSKPFLGLETKTETWVFRSRDRDLDRMSSSALESRDHGLEITTLPVPLNERPWFSDGLAPSERTWVQLQLVLFGGGRKGIRPKLLPW